MRRSRAAPLFRLPSAEPGPPASASARVGWVAGVAPDGRPQVDFPGNGDGPLDAVSTVSATHAELELAARARQPVVLLFDGGDLRRPILVGFVAATPPAAATAPAPAAPVLAEISTPALPEVATVDGRRVAIEGADEIVLRCGEASITLRRNGKIVLRGTYLETSASGTNRIKGGSVQIN